MTVLLPAICFVVGYLVATVLCRIALYRANQRTIDALKSHLSYVRRVEELLNEIVAQNDALRRLRSELGGDT